MSDNLFTITKGLPFNKVLRYETVQNGVKTPVNLTTATVLMQFRHTPLNSTVLFSASETDYALISNPATGQITISIPANITSTLNFKQAVFDIVLTVGNAAPIRLIHGTVEIEQLISRA